MGKSLLVKDQYGETVQLMPFSSPQNNIAVNGSAGAAVLSAAVTKSVVRVIPQSDCYVLATATAVAAGSVSATTGHLFLGNMPTDYPLPPGTDKLAFLAVSTAATTVCISELG